MTGHHVTIDPDAAPAAACGCGCGRPLPAAPAGGGRAPVYASRACQQRAYRQRQASAHATPAPVDPPSVADLIRDIRELAGRLDAGETIPADLPGAIRAGTRDLLACTSPVPDSPGLRLVPAPTGARSEDVTTAPPTPTQEETVTPGEGLVAPAPAGADLGHTSPSRDDRPRRRRAPAARPVVVRNVDTGIDRELSAEMSAAVRAVHMLRTTGGGEPPVVIPDGAGRAAVSLHGTALGAVSRAPHTRGWQAHTVSGGLVQAWRAGRMQTTHPTRAAAVDALLLDLALLAERARPTSLRR
jgi:hypothetical protein